MLFACVVSWMTALRKLSLVSALPMMTEGCRHVLYIRILRRMEKVKLKSLCASTAVPFVVLDDHGGGLYNAPPPSCVASSQRRSSERLSHC
jgi:hypothetical protein